VSKSSQRALLGSSSLNLFEAFIAVSCLTLLLTFILCVYKIIARMSLLD
jgi:hypothetical protein